MVFRMLLSSITLVLLTVVLAPFGVCEPGQDLNPNVIEAKAPVYPGIALAAHVRGKVVVEAEMDSNGSVLTAKTISGPPLLLSASRNAALRWRFQPSDRVRRVQLEFDFDPDASRCKPS